MNEQAVITEITDTAEAVVPEVAETIEVVRNNPILLAGVAVAATLAGGAVGYFVAAKRLEPKYRDLAEKEIAEAKAYYSGVYKSDEFETPEKAVDKLIPEEVQQNFASYRGESVGKVEVVEDEHGVSIKTTEVEVDEEDNEAETVQEVRSNIFVDGVPIEELDLEAEEPKRLSGAPFVISMDEYMENAPDHEQMNCTYFQGDSQLMDENDKLITDINGLVGEDNLDRFGQGSGDRQVVFVRNVEKKLDFEIIASKGRYSVEVLGMDPMDDEDAGRDIRHGHRRRFRESDE